MKWSQSPPSYSLDIHDRKAQGAYSNAVLFGLIFFCAGVWFVRDVMVQHPSLWADLKRGNFVALKYSLFSSSFGRAELADAVPTFVREISGLLQQERFDLLELIATDLRTKRERIAGGDAKLAVFYQALRPVRSLSQPEWKIHLAKLHKWSETQPQSVTPLIALGQNMVALSSGVQSAADLRGLANAQRKALQEGLTAVERALTLSGGTQTKDPHLFVTMLELGRMHNLPLAQQTGYYQQGLAVQPDYPQLHSAYAAHLLPHWYGTAGQSEAVLNNMTAYIPDQKAAAVAYLLATSDLIARARREKPAYNFEPKLSLLTEGLQEAEKQYGSDVTMLNRAALAFSTTPDRTTTQRLFAQLNGKAKSEIWGSQHAFNLAAGEAEQATNDSLWFGHNHKALLMIGYALSLVAVRAVAGDYSRMLTKALTAGMLGVLLLDSKFLKWIVASLEELGNIMG